MKEAKALHTLPDVPLGSQKGLSHSLWILQHVESEANLKREICQGMTTQKGRSASYVRTGHNVHKISAE